MDEISENRVTRLIRWCEGLPQGGRMLLMLTAIAVLGYGLSGELLRWFGTDEGNFLYKASLLAHGGLPYVQFNDFIPPLGHYITAGLIRCFGMNPVAIRMVVVLGWCVEIFLLYRIGRRFLPRSWAWVLVLFLWLTDTRYVIDQHHYWSGLFSLLAVDQAFRYLETDRRRRLIGCGVLSGLALWSTQSTGVLLIAAIGIFSLIDCFEQKKRGLPCWLFSWGFYWLLPVMLVLVTGVGILCLMGVWPYFYRDAVVWLLHGTYAGTTRFGYDVALGDELGKTLQPLLSPLPLWLKLLFIDRVVVAGHYLLMAALPLFGIAGIGISCYQNPDTKNRMRLLLLLSASALIVSTMSYATSMHLVSNAGPAYLLGFIVLFEASRSARWQPTLLNGMLVFLILVLLTVVKGSWEKFTYSQWVSFSGVETPLLVPTLNQQAQSLTTTVHILHEANVKHEAVFVFCESPELYLTENFRNATRYSLVMPVYVSPDQMTELMTELRINRPLFIVDDMVLPALHDDPRFRQYPVSQLQLPEIKAFMASHYQFEAWQGRYIIYRRRDF